MKLFILQHTSVNSSITIIVLFLLGKYNVELAALCGLFPYRGLVFLHILTIAKHFRTGVTFIVHSLKVLKTSVDIHEITILVMCNSYKGNNGFNVI